MHVENFVAHRGWRQHFPENTLLALREAALAGAVNIELDVQLSADRRPHIFHDPSLQRLCNQPGMIWDYSSAQLASMSAFEPQRFGNRFAGTPLSPLAALGELLNEFPAVNAYVELKGESLAQFGAAAMVDAVIADLTNHRDRCVLISFELDALILARQRGWQRCAAVFDYWPDWQLASLAELAPEIIFIDRNCVPVEADLRKLPYPVLIYEVGNSLEACDWFARGAVGVESFLIGELLQELKLV
ncbi:glycerophosphodiester phosphodiesterase family protein [Spongiibacter sp.]|uniref:glycerophosphodiester phosphodiesterase family protein n=1 Tax=Spongiibacter sp. TaxID=2024860 RepID=UPI003569434B